MNLQIYVLKLYRTYEYIDRTISLDIVIVEDEEMKSVCLVEDVRVGAVLVGHGTLGSNIPAGGIYIAFPTCSESEGRDGEVRRRSE